MHELPRSAPAAREDFEALVASLGNEYADVKHALWNTVVRVLGERGEGALAARVTQLRQRGLALARLKKLCDPRGQFDRESCRAALENYARLARGEALDRAPPRPSAPEPLADFLAETTADGASAYARLAERLLRALWGLRAAVSVRKRVVSLPRAPLATEYVFYLLRSGEPEHVESSASRIVDLDFVETGRELELPVQLGGLEATVRPGRREIHVDAFGRDLRARGGPEGRVTAMRYLMCVAVATMSHVEQLRGGDPSAYTVTLDAADRGDGKLLAYYGGFGFKAASERQSHYMVAPVPTLLKTCSGF